MRNYFKALNIPVSASREALGTACESIEQMIPAAHQADARDILSDPDRAKCYADTAEVYESMHIALSCLKNVGGVDTHRWKDRLANFDTAVEDTQDLMSLKDTW